MDKEDFSPSTLQGPLARISHRFAWRDGGGAGLTRLATEAPAVVLVQYVEEADGAKRSQDGCIRRRSSLPVRNTG